MRRRNRVEAAGAPGGRGAPTLLPALLLGLWPLLVAAAPVRAGDAAPAGPSAGTDPASAAAARPRWPLDLPERYLTSGFMEWRPGRFHAGLDLKTRSRSGFPVRAVEDGEVVRLRAGAGGYGRAVYLRGRSGRTYVYAHLERLADPLREALRRAQAAAGGWEVDVAVPAGSLPLRRGQVLALSGQSGTGGPHLHFEVRDERQRPLDPQECGFAVRDRLRPRLNRLRVLPVAPESRIEGRLSAFSAPVPAVPAADLPPLRVRGPVAFAVEVEDRSDVAGHRLAPDRLEVRLDGETVYTSRNDGFAFAEGGQALLEWLDLAGPPARWLHRWDGVSLPGRRGGAWSAAAGGLPPGRHEVRLEAVDQAGNAASARFALVVEPSAPDRAGGAVEAAAAPASGGAAGGGWAVDPLRVRVGEVGGRQLWLTPFLELESRPAAAAAGDSAGAAVGRAPGRPEAWLARPLLAAAPAAGPTAGELPGAGGGPAPEPARPVKQVHRAEAGGPLLAAAALWVVPDTLQRQEVEAAWRDQGLRPAGPAARFVAAAWPATGPVPERLPGAAAGPLDPRDGVYRQGADGRWRWAAAPEAPAAGSGAGPGFPLREPGRYALLRDLAPPVLAPARPETVGPSAPGVDPAVTPPRWRPVVVAWHEAGAGVAADGLAAWLDGVALLPEPDLPRDRLLVELPDATAPGPHALVVEVADRAGNRTRRELPLLLTASAARPARE